MCIYGYFHCKEPNLNYYDWYTVSHIFSIFKTLVTQILVHSLKSFLILLYWYKNKILVYHGSIDLHPLSWKGSGIVIYCWYNCVVVFTRNTVCNLPSQNNARWKVSYMIMERRCHHDSVSIVSAVTARCNAGVLIPRKLVLLFPVLRKSSSQCRVSVANSALE